MSGPIEELVEIRCIDVDEDRLVSPFELNLWEILDKARRIFKVELRLRYRPCSYAAVTDERIEIFIHRYHRRISEIETWLVDALGPICQDHAESMHEENGWRPEVVVWICRFSGIRGAMAFFDAKEEVFDAGSSHPDFDRLEELAEEAGRQAARLANGRQ